MEISDWISASMQDVETGFEACRSSYLSHFDGLALIWLYRGQKVISTKL